MGHELVPRKGCLPSAREVAGLLSKEFRYIKVEEGEGMQRAHAIAAWIERAEARVFLGHHMEALEHAARLRRLAPGEALTIEFGDDADTVAKMTVIPRETIKFGYQGEQNELSKRPLVDRCANVLECDVVEF
ncbi:hypothetical protein LZC95_38300 [Pendulispora brunnea]|uniref:Uncharacterized protein n=1 Tax=Pendulispora brunnea TaxID=2905690 RepID=A0ABZ2K0N0_9BACT